MTKATASSTSLKLTIKPYILFLPYLPIVFIMILIALDSLFGWGLVTRLPQSPRQIFLYSIIFENPHIIASSLILLDKEYIKFYGRTFFLRAIIVVGIIGLIWRLFGVEGFYAFFFAWTIYHVIKQQVGVGKMMNRQPSRLYNVWGWLFVSVSILIGIGIGYFSSANITIDPILLKNIIIYGGLATIALGIGLTTILKQNLGKLFLLANVGLLIASIICYLTGFTLFAILIPRMVHDITAYIFYVTHDTNRNTPEPKQVIYKITRPLMPIWFVCIGLSMSLAFFDTYAPITGVFSIAIILIIIHYITEAFTWRGTSLHRKYLSFNFN